MSDEPSVALNDIFFIVFSLNSAFAFMDFAFRGSPLYEKLPLVISACAE